MGKRITLVVKEGPFFEDATREDVSFFGLDGVVDEVGTIPGFFVAEETLKQEIWMQITCRETGWHIGLARGCGFAPTVGVQRALDLVRDAVQS